MLLVLVFAATGLVVYWSGLKSAARSTPIRNFTSTARIHQQPGLRTEDALEKPSAPLLPGPEEAEQQIASASNVYRAVRQLGWVREGDSPIFPAGKLGQSPGYSAVVAPVRQKIRVSAAGTSTPGELDIRVAYTDQDAEHAARLVNVLAENYAKDCRAEWTRRARSTYEEAREASKLAHQEWLAASARLDEVRQPQLDQQEQAQRQAQAAALAPELSAPDPHSEPPMIDNPRWVELNGRLAGLLGQLEELLVDRTPAHPEVQDIRVRISAIKGQLAATSEKIPGRPSDLPDVTIEESFSQAPTLTDVEVDQVAPAHAETVREFRKRKEAAELASRNCKEAVRVEQRAWKRYRHPPQIAVQLAQAIGLPAPQRSGMGLVWMALAAATAAAAGLGMILTGTAMEPTLTTVAQAAAVLPVPVVGTIPESSPAEKSGSAHSGQTLVRANMILGGLVLICGCAVVVLRALGGF